MKLILLVSCFLVASIGHAQDVRVTWTNAARNVEKTPYINPKTTRVSYGKFSRKSEDYKKHVDVPHPSECLILDLEPGIWYVSADHENQDGVRSDWSGELRLVVSKGTMSKRERRREAKRNRRCFNADA